MDWLYVLVVLAACGLSGWLAVRSLARRSLAGITFSVGFLALAVVAPILLAYGWAVGVVAATLGGLIATVQSFRTASWLQRLSLLAVAAIIAITPVFTLLIGNAQASERVARCQADLAVRTIDGERADSGRYPTTVHDMAIASENFGDPACPIYNDVNWLYRPGHSGYVVGYWTDWVIGKNVCLHSSGQQGWTCGLNRWGPFHPGENDSRG